MTDATTLRQITSELAALTDEELALAPDDFAGRYRIARRRDALRERVEDARRAFEAQRPTDEITAELEELRRVRNQRVARHADRVMMSGPGGTGGAPGAVSPEAVDLVRLAGEASGVDTLSARIAVLEQTLAARSAKREEPGTV